MANLKNFIKSLAKSNLSFLAGLIYGSIVVAITSYIILGPVALDEENLSDVDRLKECIFEDGE
jgi:hypothetical protein